MKHLLIVITLFAVSCGMITPPETVTVVRDGVECQATLGADGQPKDVKCDLGDAGPPK